MGVLQRDEEREREAAQRLGEAKATSADFRFPRKSKDKRKAIFDRTSDGNVHIPTHPHVSCLMPWQSDEDFIPLAYSTRATIYFFADGIAFSFASVHLIESRVFYRRIVFCFYVEIRSTESGMLHNCRVGACEKSTCPQACIMLAA